MQAMITATAVAEDQTMIEMATAAVTAKLKLRLQMVK